MPLEIRELYIKAVIDTGAGAPPSSRPGEIAANAAAPDKPREQDDIIAICVEKVLEVLKDKQER